MLRNIFAFEDESPAWKSVLERFPNHVPRFDTKAEATEFTKQYAPLIGSNPDYPALQQSVSTLVDWKQIETYLLPKIKEYDTRWAKKTSEEIDMTSNRFFRGEKNASASEVSTDEKAENLEYGLYDYIRSRMDLKIHQELSYESRYNTLRYLFFHTKMAIYVMIRNNQLVIFAPFVNKDYENTWGNRLRVDSSDGTISTYYDEKKQRFRAKQKEQVLPVNQWWANGNILCNKYTDGQGNETVQYWGDHFLMQLKDMFSELCNQREIPDCEFFINKRDYPQLKFNPIYEEPVEPYGFIYDCDDRDVNQDIPLPRHLYKSYLPILSFYLSKRFADIPFPPSEDWEAATGKVYPASFAYTKDSETNEINIAAPRDFFTHTNLEKFQRPWSSKEPTAFFRGSATGGGVRPETNQRIHIASISHEWSTDATKFVFDKEKNQNFPYLDAKITGWNQREKKIATEAMTCINPSDYSFSGRRADNFVEIYRQSAYKYIIYVEGHCAACRYGFMMSLGSVILKVNSKCVADSMWYFPLLKPYYDHIPINEDYSNLQEILQWCHTHDKECEQIAANAKRLYDNYISLEGILDYLQCICYEISLHWKDLPDSLHVNAMTIPEKKKMPMIPRHFPAHISPHCTKDKESIHRDPILCTYCQALVKANEEKEKQRLLLEKQQQFLAMHGINPNSAKASNKPSISFGETTVRLIGEDLEKRKADLRKRRKGANATSTPTATEKEQIEEEKAEPEKKLPRTESTDNTQYWTLGDDDDARMI